MKTPTHSPDLPESGVVLVANGDPFGLGPYVFEPAPTDLVIDHLLRWIAGNGALQGVAVVPERDTARELARRCGQPVGAITLTGPTRRVRVVWETGQVFGVVGMSYDAAFLLSSGRLAAEARRRVRVTDPKPDPSPVADFAAGWSDLAERRAAEERATEIGRRMERADAAAWLRRAGDRRDEYQCAALYAAAEAIEAGEHVGAARRS